MNITTTILFLLASMGVVNGFITGLYLLISKKSDVSKKYLGLLLITLSIRIGKSVLVYFDPSIDKLILQIGLSACALIGPFFYFFVRAKTQNEKQIFRKDINLLLCIGLVVLIAGFIYPYRNHPDLWNIYFVKSIYGVWAFFVFISLPICIRHIKKIYNVKKSHGLIKDQFTIIITSVLFITLTYQFALYVRGFTYIWGSLIFTIFFYYMMVNVLRESKLLPKVSAPIQNADSMLENVRQIMREHKLYLKAKLKLEEVALAVELNRNELSRLLNEEYGYGFSQFVNEFRVHQAKTLIKERPELTFEGIGYDSGFNSKSSFFAAFKKISGMTPAQYKKEFEMTKSE